MDINVEPAWDLVTGASNVTVAIVDTGVDLNHEDLKASLLQGYTVGDLTGYGAPKIGQRQILKGMVRVVQV